MLSANEYDVSIELKQNPWREGAAGIESVLNSNAANVGVRW